MEEYEKIKPYKALKNKTYSEIRITSLTEENKFSSSFHKWKDPSNPLYYVGLDGNSYLGKAKKNVILLNTEELEDKYIIFRIFNILKKRLLDQLDESEIISSKNDIVKTKIPEYILKLDTDIYLNSIRNSIFDRPDVLKIDGVTYKIKNLGSKDRKYTRLVQSYKCLYDTLITSTAFSNLFSFTQFSRLRLYFYLNEDGTIDEDKPIYTYDFAKSDQFLECQGIREDNNIDRFKAHDMRLSKTVNSILYPVPKVTNPSYSLLLDKDTDKTYMVFDTDHLIKSSDVVGYIMTLIKKIINKSNPKYVRMVETSENRKIDEVGYIINELSKDGLVNDKYLFRYDALMYKFNQLAANRKPNGKVASQINTLFRNEDFLIDNYRIINVKNHYYIFDVDDDLYRSYDIFIRVYEGMNIKSLGFKSKRVICEVDLNSDDIVIKDDPDAYTLATDYKAPSNMITKAAEEVYGKGDFYTFTRYPGLNFF